METALISFAPGPGTPLGQEQRLCCNFTANQLDHLLWVALLGAARPPVSFIDVEMVSPNCLEPQAEMGLEGRCVIGPVVEGGREESELGAVFREALGKRSPLQVRVGPRICFQDRRETFTTSPIWTLAGCDTQ